MQESPPFLPLVLHTCVVLRSLLPDIYSNQEQVSCILAIPYNSHPHPTSRNARILPRASFSQERAVLQNFHLCFFFPSLLSSTSFMHLFKKEIFLWDPTFPQPHQPCLRLHLFLLLFEAWSLSSLPPSKCMPALKPRPSPILPGAQDHPQPLGLSADEDIDLSHTSFQHVLSCGFAMLLLEVPPNGGLVGKAHVTVGAPVGPGS